MSVQASTRVMEYSEASGVNRLVLLVMANRAGGDFDECFASTDRIAFECRIDVRTVQRAVKRLVGAGELALVGIHPKHRTNIYRVMPAATVSLFPAAGVAESHPPGATTPPAPPERKEQGLGLSVASASSQPPVRAETARQRDRLFEALLDVENILPGDKLTRSARGKLNSAAKELRDIGASAEDVRARAATYRRVHPTWDLTATALVSHWPSLNGSTRDSRPEPSRSVDDMTDEEIEELTRRG